MSRLIRCFAHLLSPAMVVALAALFVALGGLVVAAVLSPAGAAAGSFTDPGARLATLVPDGSVSAITALPDGDVVFVVGGQWDGGERQPGRLMLLTAEGAVRRLSGDAEAVAPDGPDSVLVARPFAGRARIARIVRVDVLGGGATTVASIRAPSTLSSTPSIDGIAALDDGTAVAYEDGWWWLIGRDTRVRRMPLDAPFFPGEAILALPSGRFAFGGGDDGLTVADQLGHARTLTDHGLGPITVSGDGGFVALPPVERPTDSRELVHISADGTVTPLLALPARSADVLGIGDGLTAAMGGLRPRLMAVAFDGSLVFAESPRYDQPATGLRALVPPDSTRPWIALTQGAYNDFKRGRITYVAHVPGAVDVAVQRGNKVVARASGQIGTAGEGELSLPRIPTPARYELGLRLTTSTGAAEAPAQIDTRLVLPLREARAALSHAYSWSEGDEGGSSGNELGACRRSAARTIRCLLLFFESGVDRDESWSEVSTPLATTVATLHDDRIRTEKHNFPVASGFPERRLTVKTATKQHLLGQGRMTLTVRSALSARVKLTVGLRWKLGRHAYRQYLTAWNRIHRHGIWRAVVRVPAGALAAIQAGHTVRGDITVRAVSATRWGRRTEEHGITVTLLR